MGSKTSEFQVDSNLDYDRETGVKGIDSGVTKIPRIFIDQGIILEKNNTDCSNNQLSVPIIALQGINEDSALRAEVINQVRNACANWGFFQVIHHGIPVSVLDEMIDGICQFHEQNTEVKKQFYTRDATRKVLYLRNYDLYKPKATNWRDSLGCIMSLDDPAHPQSCLKFADSEFCCSDIVMDYSKQVLTLGFTLFELLSQALGLNPSCLNDLGCADLLLLMRHYYPPCPQPKLIMGTTNYKDILHHNYWIDVPCIPGALVVNVGDLLQLISNEKFKSMNHRVLAKWAGPKISVACFLIMQANNKENESRLYGQIKELLSENNPPI
ncbi:hypothetical protein ES332_D02G058900v1 [Gossypium tomentosum]|uniref:Fe2OG dioxygenase domain-containing protein n=1 Tax=Gossypium tomentosum TaxID=34277 RepID=A0A5D2LTN2_GOSTO|nr:hypothetical protein ES332_D02G058900v1 [Gossypium tomentosum]